MFHVSTLACRRCTHMCSRCTHVCVLSKKHMFVFQLNTFMRVPQVNVYVGVQRCASARAACTVSVVYICVLQVYTHVCLNCPCDRALAQPHSCSSARARLLSHALAQPHSWRSAEARSTAATHVQQRNACQVHDCIILIHPC